MSPLPPGPSGPDELGPPSQETVQAQLTQPPQARPSHKDPEHIGQYRILGRIGEGGMGVVYRAEQREPVRRVVALKVIKLGMDTSEVVARFEAERQALALMNHPNVAKVLEAGMTETGRPYFAMEFVPGIDFTRYCEDEKLTVRQRLGLFIPVCQAIQHAHQKGIIHRDLKPSNVLVQLVDGKPVPKVIDFGIAKATNQALTQHTLFTQTGAMIGTPEYMSPEQAITSGLDVDTRTDIYSLGVILYQVLTGTLPLDPKALREAGMEGMARLIKTSVPQKPSTRLLTVAGTGVTEPTSAQSRNTRLLQKELQGDLDWIVLKAIEKDRARRYETANALAMDLQRHLDNEPVLARPPSASYRVQKFVSRHRVGVLAGTAVLVALLVGLTLSSLGFVRARAERKRANTARVEAQTQRDVADKARIEAQTERKIAEDQKQLAVENARKADENAKKADENATKAELRLASGLVSQADAFGSAGRFSEAHQLYIDAYAKFVELKQPLTVPEAGLWSLYHQASFPLLSFTGHTDRVCSVAIAPDGRTALSGSEYKTLKLWDLASGKELRTFTGHTDTVNSVAIAPDGRTALSGSADRTLKLWDLASGKELRTFTGHTNAVNDVALSPDGRTALSGSSDNTLKLWDLASGKVLRTFTGHTAQVICVAIAPDGRTALSSSWDRTLKLWDLASGKELPTFTGHTHVVGGVAIAPDGRTALSGSDDHTLKLWDLASGKELRTFTGHTAEVSSVALSPDGRTALSASADKTLKLWDLASGKELRTFAGHTAEVSSVAIASDGRTALSGSWDHTEKLWDLAGGKELPTFTGHTDGVWSVAIAPDGRTALSGSGDRTLKLWDLASGKELHTFTGHTDGVWSVAIAPDGRTALSASGDKTLKLWDLAGGKELRTFTGHNNEVYCVAIAPDGRTALSSSWDKTLKLWDLASGKELRTFTGHADRVLSVAIAPDGRTALSGSWDHTLKQWNLASGKELRTFTGHTGEVFSVAIAPDGRTALSASADKTLKLWDLASGKELRTFTGHTAEVISVAIASDCRTALSGSWDHTLKLWDLAGGKELRTFSGHTNWVNCVAFAPNGRAALSGSEDTTLKFWDLARGTAHRAFEPRVATAQARLQHAPNDAAALATLGEWYAFRGMDQWAVEFLTRAREGGAAVGPQTLARCYWNLNRNDEARREFQVALEQSPDAAERTYLGWCITGIDTEPQRKHQHEALVAAQRLREEAARQLAEARQLGEQGHLKEAGDAFGKVIQQFPDEHWAWYYEGCLLAYQQDGEGYRKHCKAMLERFGGSNDPQIDDKTVKTCLLLAGGGDARQLLATADRVQAGPAGSRDLQSWFNFLGALARYRTGDYAGCLKLAQACKNLGGQDNVARTATADLLLAMASQQLGQPQKARAALELALDRIGRDLPMPSDEHPATGNLENWLICQTLRREAEALIAQK